MTVIPARGRRLPSYEPLSAQAPTPHPRYS